MSFWEPRGSACAGRLWKNVFPADVRRDPLTPAKPSHTRVFADAELILVSTEPGLFSASPRAPRPLPLADLSRSFLAFYLIIHPANTTTARSPLRTHHLANPPIVFPRRPSASPSLLSSLPTPVFHLKALPLA